jgi:hypothetical protein
MKVVQVARQDDGALVPRRQYDGGVDNVLGAGSTAQGPRCLREGSIERRHGRVWAIEKSAQGHLPGATSPDLAEHTRGNDEPRAGSQCLATKSTHAFVGPLEGNQRTGV